MTRIFTNKDQKSVLTPAERSLPVVLVAQVQVFVKSVANLASDQSLTLKRGTIEF